MKYTIQQIPSGEDELILRYQRLNDEVQAVLEFMNSPQKKLIGTTDGGQTIIDLNQILYAESVDRLGVKEWAMMLCGSAVYAASGHLLGWFDGSIAVAVGFGAYMVVCYLCTFWVYKIKRAIDAKMLNSDLKRFQEREKLL